MNAVGQAIHRLAGISTAAVTPIIAVGTALTHSLLAPLTPIKALAAEIGALVGLFNPGIVTQFTLTMNDAMAVMGSALIPVMQGMTVYVRAFGDVLAGLLPVITPLTTAIGNYVAMFGHGLYEVFQAAAPLIQVVTDALTNFLVYFTRLEAGLIGMTAALVEMLVALFGLESRFDPKANSKGFAARQTSVGSVEDFANKLFASTARNIYARGGAGEKSQAALLEEIQKSMEKGRELVKKGVDALDGFWEWFKGNKAAIEKFLKIPEDKDAGAAGTVGAAAIAAAIARALGAMGVKPPW